MTKICNRKDCTFKGEPQPIDQFGKCTAAKTGINPTCRTCTRLNWKRSVHPTKFTDQNADPYEEGLRRYEEMRKGC